MIHVVTACYFKNREPIWRLERSAQRHGVPLHPYGEGIDFKSWRHAKVTKLIEVAKSCRESHLLYTDGQDAWFLAGLDEIQRKYDAIHAASGATIVISAERECYPFGYLAEHFTARSGLPWRYINAGQFVGERDAIISTLEMLAKDYYELGENDQAYWCQAWADGKLGHVWIDQECELFQAMARESVGEGCSLERDGERLVNVLTRSKPSLLHFNGGGNKERRMAEVWR